MVVENSERVVTVRIVYDTYNPMYVPIEVGANRNAPHITIIPENLWFEWHTLKARLDEIQQTFKSKYELASMNSE